MEYEVRGTGVVAIEMYFMVRTDRWEGHSLSATVSLKRLIPIWDDMELAEILAVMEK